MAALTILVIEDPAAEYLHALKPPVQAKVLVSNQLSVLLTSAPEADVILTGFLKTELLPAVLPRSPKVRWVHSLRAGVERLLFPELIAGPVTLTNARGVYKRPLADFVVAAALFFARDIRRMLRNQDAGVWEHFDVGDLQGAVMGIVGYGEIGKACAERARTFGMQVLGVRRRPELSRGDPRLQSIFGLEALREVLAASDYVVLTAPDTTDTHDLIGKAEIASMKRSAVLINIGRGALIDEAALAGALDRSEIRGAALDVFKTEPLPSGHPFYRLKNLLLSPHCADQVPRWRELAVESFLDNFARFSRGEPIENVVDKRAGY